MSLNLKIFKLNYVYIVLLSYEHTFSVDKRLITYTYLYSFIEAIRNYFAQVIL